MIPLFFIHICKYFFLSFLNIELKRTSDSDMAEE